MTYVQDSNGNTIVPQFSTNVYVDSAAGNDSNKGNSPSTPVKTLKRAYALMTTSNSALLLKTGGVWNENFPGWWKTPNTIISTYGSPTAPLPVIHVPSGQSFIHVAAGNVGIFDIELQGWNDPSTGATGTYGFEIGAPDVWIEGCLVEKFYQNIVAMGSLTGMLDGITIRRNRILDAFCNGSAHAQGLYAYCLTNFSLIENVFDHNGWNAAFPNAIPTEFNHNVYLAVQNQPANIKGNIFANASAQGCMARAGGTMDNNLFINNGIHGQSAYLAGNTGTMTNNVATTTPDATIVGGAFGLASVNGTATGNIATQCALPLASQFAFEADARGQDFPLTPDCKLTFENNIAWNWSGVGFRCTSQRPYLAFLNNVLGAIPVSNLPKLIDFLSVMSKYVASGNVYQMADITAKLFGNGSNTTNWTDWVKAYGETNATLTTRAAIGAKYLDPNRTLAKYDISFLSTARTMNRRNWNGKYMANGFNSYIREGFGTPVVPSGPSVGSVYIRDLTKTGSPDAGELKDGGVITLANAPKSFAMRADIANAHAVTFSLDGKDHVENFAPWCIMGDQVPVSPLSAGAHVLTIVATDSSGKKGQLKTIHFTVK